MTQDKINCKRRFTAEALSPYWSGKVELILDLPAPQKDFLSTEPLPPDLVSINLPEWAVSLGVNGALLVPRHRLIAGEQAAWERTDWLGAMFWYLNGLAEREFENRHGPIHSYSYRLRGWDPKLWEYAWVNRIALFLRRWAGRLQGDGEDRLFGPLPEGKVILTHDVDAVSKTFPIRIKQTVFHAINAFRCLFRGHPHVASEKLKKGLRFLLSQDDYWCFDAITNLEEEFGLKSCFNFYGGQEGYIRGFKKFLFDPNYSVAGSDIRQQICKLYSDGWSIGLHASFEAWADSNQMLKELKCVEDALGHEVKQCRQHWLRFSWSQTWRAQEEAGLSTDTTLGFNDRPGFRNGAALQFSPWDISKEAPLELVSIPMVMMDSHFYDYLIMDDSQRKDQIKRWISEVYAVGGTMTVIWHQHVMSPDYGWAEGYRTLLASLKKGSAME